ncbi:hypothetical protein [Nocardioides sp. CFH 31398]|uniref:hypothetical protein n=1 Tax=Nocardioides sp. CFH 31398 TaxID=2919579 RepID=UPI001F05DA87|nr:hypothetical protein [Nocardioides sp. CFH 31398]MCH1866663.1 hypothetical protein [Nocardioides sp. CFH 31398]
MRLVAAVLGFLLKKVGLFLVLVLVLFLGYLVGQTVVPSLREAAADRERLQQLAAERADLEADLERLEDSSVADQSASVEYFESLAAEQVDGLAGEVADARAEAEDLREDARVQCDLWQRLGDLLTPGDTCEAAEAAAEAAARSVDTVQESLEQAQDDAAVLADPSLTPAEKLDRIGEGGGSSFADREIEATESDLARNRAEQESLEQTRSTAAGWVVDQWARSWRWLVGLAVLLILLPPALRTVSYFVLMPLVHRAQTPIRLADPSEDEAAELSVGEARRTLTVDLADGEVLSARSEYVRPVQGRTRSRLLYDWSAPFISFAAGLSFLSRISGGEGVTSATLGSPDDADAYLMRIDFTDHPGVVIHPRHVVGVVGAPELRTRWRWGIQSFATWQVRYILFAGTGGLVVEGVGDAVATNPRGGSTRIEQNLLMGFDSRLLKGVNRTEVFWPYLRGKEPLVDDELTGAHPLFWQKSSAEGPTNPVTRTFDAVFSALGKVLGF